MNRLEGQSNQHLNAGAESVYDKERYQTDMFERPSYPTTIYFRINLWKACLDVADKEGLFDKNVDDPRVALFVKSLHMVHGANKRYDNLFAANVHGRSRLHLPQDQPYKKDHVFFRVEQKPTPELDPMAADLFDDFTKYGMSEFYGPYVHTSPFTSCLDCEGKIAPIDNAKNWGDDERGDSKRNHIEELAFTMQSGTTYAYLQKHPELVEKIEQFYPEYAEAMRGNFTDVLIDGSAMVRTGGSTSPMVAPMELPDFKKFFTAYPMLALIVFPPPFTEIMIKTGFRPQNIEYRPLEKAKSIDDYPEDYKRMLLGLSVNTTF